MEICSRQIETLKEWHLRNNNKCDWLDDNNDRATRAHNYYLCRRWSGNHDPISGQPVTFEEVKLTTDLTQAAYSQQYGEKCIWGHDAQKSEGGTRRDFVGENLAATSGSSWSQKNEKFKILFRALTRALQVCVWVTLGCNNFQNIFFNQI